MVSETRNRFFKFEIVEEPGELSEKYLGKNLK